MAQRYTQPQVGSAKVTSGQAITVLNGVVSSTSGLVIGKTGSPTVGYSPIGMVASGSGAQAYTLPTTLQIPRPCTVMVVARMNTGAGTNSMAIGDTSSYGFLWLASGANTTRWRIPSVNFSSYNEFNYTNTAPDKTANYILSIDENGDAVMYQNGIQVATSTANNLSGFLIGQILNGYGGTSFALKGDVALAWWDTRKITAHEAAQLAANPWRVFKPSTTISNIFTAGAGGSTSGNASGALPSLTLNAITGSAGGGALASGTLSTLVLSAITGTASAGIAGSATGSLPTMQLVAITGNASGGALATGGNTTITLSPITGVGIAGGATAVGTLAAMYLAAPTGYATSGATAVGTLPTIQLSPITGIAYSILSNSALPKYTVKSSNRNYSTTHIRGSYVSTKKRP